MTPAQREKLNELKAIYDKKPLTEQDRARLIEEAKLKNPKRKPLDND
jgi:hypothetical protein